MTDDSVTRALAAADAGYARAVASAISEDDGEIPAATMPADDYAYDVIAEQLSDWWLDLGDGQRMTVYLRATADTT